ncbi:MAG: RNA polymerase factor sigma-54 [Bacteroidaceae bacterium]|nr:RNA polymerase factor sigma-54 [Bacteroidaceae bacterium]
MSANRNIQTQTLSQVQTLSPQQLLVAQLTEMPVEELRSRVERELEENPTLERMPSTESGSMEPDEGGGNENDAADFTADYSPDDVPDFIPGQGDNGGATSQWRDSRSFHDQLEEQIGYFKLSEHEEELLRYLIGSLDNDGLLRVPLTQIQDELEVYHNLQASIGELEHVLNILQHFEPAGVGARNLRECLLLQVQLGPDSESHDKKQLETLLRNYFDLLMLKRWDRIRVRMHLTDVEVARLQYDVRHLNPRPGNSPDESIEHNQHHISPDFIVETDSYGQVTVNLAYGNMPNLRANQEDQELLLQYSKQKPAQLSPSERDALTYVRENVGRAQQFIDAIQTRRQNLLKTMTAIVKRQHLFFETGDDTQLIPMTMGDLSKDTGLHISSISRAANSKWVQTTFGTYPLKWFFTTAARQDGENVSIRKIKAILKELIDKEDKHNPLSDETLTVELRKRNIDIARRTTAKYRESMGIPVARLRKTTI